MGRRYDRRDPVERFWSKVEKGQSCWEWSGAIANTGYGVFNDGQRIVGAHRFSYQLAFGSIPHGSCVMHSCDNRKCVRPEHLSTGTKAENNHDMKRKGRARNARFGGEEHPRSKLTRAAVLEARGLWTNRGKIGRSADGWTVAKLATKYGVGTSTMHSALVGRSW